MQSCITGLIITTILFSEDISPLSAAEAASNPGENVSKLAPELAPRFLHFVAEKRTLAETMAKQHNLAVPTVVRDFFVAAQEQDWVGTSNLFSQVLSEVYPPAQRRLPLLFWGTIHETFGTYEMLTAWRPKFLIQCGINIVNSIPAGSIYFGGSEAGRFLPSVFSESHSEGRPFFTLTQNALSNPAYAEYINEM